MKEIKLTQGKVALVDDADFEFLNQWKWIAIKDENTFYAARGEYKNGKQTTLQMHRVLLGLINPKIEGEHIDRNGLNNQRNNLRIANRSQNCSNRPSFKGSSSKYKGVSRFGNTNKWRARIQKDSVSKTIGIFNNEQEAALAYNNEAEKLHGDFAYLNKIAS